ncbi:MAG: dihydroxyacetone kinase subunit L [Caldisericum sp.]|jgi:dihydroxyacetone kinase-like protein|nr:dihydroxyacetone kinase subunit L [Caldisericum sp.]
MKLTNKDVLEYLKKAAKLLNENREYLTELDSAIGDADHGINMDRGFQTVLKNLPTLEGKDIGAILKAVGMYLVSTVGGASGPLYGTAFIQAGTALAGKFEIDEQDILKAMQAALEVIIMRGKAERGDKTMIDTIAPAIESLKKSLSNGTDFVEALEEATRAAEEGMKSTIPMLAKKGRASYLGERSIGHQDPGATSSYLLIKLMLELIKEKQINN